MVTAGIDLASQDDNTAVCVAEWSETGNSGTISRWSPGWSDDDLIELMRDPDIDRIGIDAPFGWPFEYVSAISAYRDHGIWPVADPDCLRFRATERQLDAGLSPSLDPLVWVTLRCARLLDRCAREDSTGIDRTGEGRFVEVYPAAALGRWGQDPKRSPEDPGSYKGEKPASVVRRKKLIEALTVELDPIMALPPDFVEDCGVDGGDHLVDALVAALVARAMAVGNCDLIPPDARRRAESEGWIRLPKGPHLRDDVTAQRAE